jgi:activator of HSP90 ATPase
VKSDSIKVSAVIPAEPKAVYAAWMSSNGHGGMTGSAWDGYISGKTLELEKDARIAQTWRTTEFGPGDPDSNLEVLLQAAKGGTKVTLVHTNIPVGHGEEYRRGWIDFYFKPMKEYFASR